jgi:hypothetical protein
MHSAPPTGQGCRIYQRNPYHDPAEDSPLYKSPGKLWHASIILPAAKGFFSPLNDAMRGSPKLIGLGANSEVRRALKDLASLMHLLSS